MRQFLSLALLLIFSIPVGISLSGCKAAEQVTFCNGGDSGLVAGQITSLDLEPRVYGISLNFGSIGQVNTPAATDCKGSTVSVSKFEYGSTNVNVADISPTGSLCAGRWNRNVAGVADYTTCTPPTVLPTASPAAYVTVSAGGAVSNALPVYIHPIVTNVELSVVDAVSGVPVTSCVSQGQQAQLKATVFDGTGTDITSRVGPLTYGAQDPSILTINQNGLATAQLPGSTIISANTSLSGTNSAGTFSTCPPANITLSIPNTSATNISLSQNTPQPLTTTVVDTKGATITGLSLEYISTNPRSITVSSAGLVTSVFPGSGSITAICQPSTCNNAALTQLSNAAANPTTYYGNGKPVTSNPIEITTPGTVNTVLYMASTNSQYLVTDDFRNGVVGGPVRLPYVPNSMAIDQAGTTIYLGSTTELMIVNAGSNSVAREDAAVPGKVISLSPDGTLAIINDPVHKLIYVYNTTGSNTSSFGGQATRAQFTQDDQQIYITGTDIAGAPMLFVYSIYNGWHTYALASSASNINDVAITVPNIGAYIGGPSTTAHSYCADTSTVNPPTDPYFPQATTGALPATDRLTATNDGTHILGATATPAQVVDINVTLPVGACPVIGTATFHSTPFTRTLPVTPLAITGIQSSSDSSVSFVTYTPTGSTATGTILPAYRPVYTVATSGVITPGTGAGTVQSVTLANGATAPVAGVFSPDGKTFFVGTSGDNVVHLITVPTPTVAAPTPLPTDSSQVAPALPACAVINAVGLCTVQGTGSATPDLLVDKPRPTT